jgi:hypothetical protein
MIGLKNDVCHITINQANVCEPEFDYSFTVRNSVKT